MSTETNIFLVSEFLFMYDWPKAPPTILPYGSSVPPCTVLLEPIHWR